jgi:hypothetical protein
VDGLFGFGFISMTLYMKLRKSVFGIEGYASITIVFDITVSKEIARLDRTLNLPSSAFELSSSTSNEIPRFLISAVTADLLSPPISTFDGGADSLLRGLISLCSRAHVASRFAIEADKSLSSLPKST